MVRIFRVSVVHSERYSQGKRWTYQSKEEFDKKWLSKMKKSIALCGTKEEFLTEELIDGKWTVINQWNNGKL